MNRSIVKNYAFSLLFKLLDMIIPLVTTPYLTRVLGGNGMGIYGYTSSIATFFVLFASAGINVYGQREIAYVQDDQFQRTKVFSEVQLIKTLLVLISGSIYWLVFAENEKYGIYYKVLFIMIIANMFDISWFFQGMEEFKKTAIKNIFFRIIGIIAVFLFVKSEEQLLIYFICCTVPVLLGNISMWIYLRDYINWSNIASCHISRHIIPIISLFIPQIAIEVYTVLDKTMLGILSPDIEEVAYYEQSQKIVKVALRILTSFGLVMMSRMSNDYAKHGKEGMYEGIKLSVTFTMLIGSPIMFGLISIAHSFVPWFFGNEFEIVSTLLVIEAPLIMIIGFSNIIGTQFFIPTNQQKIYTISIITGAISNFILNCFLIPHFNAVGAAIASVFAEMMVTLIQFIYVKKKLPIAHYIYEGRKYIVCAFLMFVILKIFDHVCKLQLVFISIFQIIMGIIIYITLLIISKDKMWNKEKN